MSAERADMRRFTGVLFTALLLLGCSSAADTGGDEDAGVDQETKDRIFAEMLWDDYPETVGIPQENLVAVGRASCGVMDESDSYAAALATMVTLGKERDFSPGMIGAVVGMSTVAFCPEHAAGMQRLSERYGR